MRKTQDVPVESSFWRGTCVDYGVTQSATKLGQEVFPSDVNEASHETAKGLGTRSRILPRKSHPSVRGVIPEDLTVKGERLHATREEATLRGLLHSLTYEEMVRPSSTSP